MKKINPILQVRYEGIGYKGIRIQPYFPIPLYLYSSLFLLELIISNPLSLLLNLLPITICRRAKIATERHCFQYW